MVSVETHIFPKFNVDAKPFEMCLPPNSHYVRDSLSSESSDSSDYALHLMATNYADDSANTNSDGDGPFLDLSDPLSDSDNQAGLKEEPLDGLDVFVPPDDELRERIVKQVEFYFSDVNLTKDAFLLKHVKRNKEGFVSLKLISSFKKVKSLTKDWRVVAFSLKTSDKLVVNDTGTKVGRKDPLPPYDETTPTRTVIAMNLPLDRPTVETVTELFIKCGDIALIRILRPGAPVPPDIKQFVHKHPGIGTCVCAVIEFTSADGAHRAVSEMGGKNNDWRSMHVVEMVKGKKSATTTGNNGNGNKIASKRDSPKSENEEVKKEESDKKKKRNKKRSPKGGEMIGKSDPLTIDLQSPQGRRKNLSQIGGCGNGGGDVFTSSSPLFDNGLTANGKQLFNAKMSPVVSSELIFRQKATTGASMAAGCSGENGTNGCSNGSLNTSNGNGGSNGTNSPWVHRRRLAAKENGQSPLSCNNRRVEVVNGGQNGNATKLLVPEGVVRLPRGPDGTMGFHGGRGQRSQSNTPISVMG